MQWIIGFVIGTTVALMGNGGGSLTVPMLVLAGLPAVEAVGAAMIFFRHSAPAHRTSLIARKNVHAKYLATADRNCSGLLLGTWSMYVMNRSS